MNKYIAPIVVAFTMLASCTNNQPQHVPSSHTIASIPNVYLKATPTYVSDPDSLLDATDEQVINETLSNLEAESTIEVAVVAVNSIGEADARQFGWELFNHWGIGKEGTDNGLLMLLVVDQRTIVFETGYGIEAILPDVVCKRIQDQVMVPLLKNSCYGEAMVKGVATVTHHLLYNSFDAENAQAIEEPTETDAQAEREGNSNKAALPVFWIIFTGIFVVIGHWVMLSHIRKIIAASVSDAQKYLDLSKTNKGAIGCLFIVNPIAAILLRVIYYFVYIRRYKQKARICPQCHRPHIVIEKGDRATPYLTDNEKMEQLIQSVKHYVFHCQSCQHIEKIGMPHSLNFSECSACGARCLKTESEKVVTPATTSTTGLKMVTRLCVKCQYTGVAEETIPKIIPRSHSSRSHSSSGRSSRSSSSRGGGRSGGGGSSSRF